MPALTNGQPSKWADLGVRALSAGVLVPAVIVDVWAGGVWFHLFVALIGILMALEWVTIVHRQNPIQFALHAAAAMCGTFLPLEADLIPALIAIAVLGTLSIALATQEPSDDPIWRYLGVAYVSLPPIALVTLERPQNHIAARASPIATRPKPSPRIRRWPK